MELENITIRINKNSRTGRYSADVLINGKVLSFGSFKENQSDAVKSATGFIDKNLDKIVKDVESGNINNWWIDESEGKVNG